MPLNPDKRKRFKEAEKRLHKLEKKQPEKMQKVRKNLRAIGYSDEEIMEILPKLPQKTIDEFSGFEPRFMENFEPGAFGADELLEEDEE